MVDKDNKLIAMDLRGISEWMGINFETKNLPFCLLNSFNNLMAKHDMKPNDFNCSHKQPMSQVLMHLERYLLY